MGRMNRKLILAPAAVAALLLLAGCSSPAPEPTPTATGTIEPAPAPTQDTGDVGTDIPVDGPIDPAIGISGDGMTLEPQGLPAGIPLFGNDVMIESFVSDGTNMELAFIGPVENIMALLPAFQAQGFTISGSDVLLNASKEGLNVAIYSDPAELPNGASYKYVIFKG